MDRLKYIIPVVALLLGACSSDEWQGSSSPLPERSAVQFRAVVGEGEEAEFESAYFEEGNEIRIFCPISYSSPDFEDGAKGTYIYTYSRTEDADIYPYKFQGKNGGFDWRTLVPTSLYYVFEAMYFPGNKYLDEVPTNQNDHGMLEKADMLIAHHRQTLSERGEPVHLTFHHAFAMVQVVVKIPVSDSPTDGPFPRDAINDVYMKSMLTGYEVNYAQVINNDGLRMVGAPAADEARPPETPGLRHDIHMRQVSVTDISETVDGSAVPYQMYVFQGIVPAQRFLSHGSFKVQKHDGGEPRFFKYVPNTSSLSLISSHVLNLSLRIDPDSQDVAVITAEVEPWGRAGGSMEIGPIQ